MADTPITYNCRTTLAEIRDQDMRDQHWRKLLTHLGKSKADIEPLHLVRVIEGAGFYAALWCLRCPSLERLSRHYQAWCAEKVLHRFESVFPDDSRIRDQIAVLRRDDANREERADARDAAWLAASAAEWAGRDRPEAAEAARVAAWDSAAIAAGELAATLAKDPTQTTARDSEWDALEHQLRKMIGAAG